jgi:hypothetical protein
MENFVIHIFGYGETQFITNDKSLKYETKNLTKVEPLIDAIWNLKPSDFSGEKKYHVINFFSKNDVRWIDENSFQLKEEESLSTMIDELITEIKEYKPN